MHSARGKVFQSRGHLGMFCLDAVEPGSGGQQRCRAASRATVGRLAGGGAGVRHAGRAAGGDGNAGG